MGVITLGTRVQIALTVDGECGDQVHSAVEDGLRGEVTGERVADHGLFVLFRGRGRASRLSGDPFALLPLGRWYRANELEQLDE